MLDSGEPEGDVVARSLELARAPRATPNEEGALTVRFEHFVRAHRDRALGLAWRLLGADDAAAEDVVQEAFVRAYRALGRFRQESSLGTWYTRILIREVRRHQRWQSVRERWKRLSTDRAVQASSAPGPDPALRKRIAAALNRLPRGQREAFVLVHMEHFTIPEAAASLGKSPGTIKSHLHRALRKLRSDLADLYESPPGGEAS